VTYTHGHHPSVLRSHTWRTAENSCAYLLPWLQHGDSLLDVGCGPGTITVDLAQRVAPGPVVGLDAATSVLHGATALPVTEGTRVGFCAGSVLALPFDDTSVDVVHAHQVLQHLADPVAALSEVARVLRPGGILAVRDADFGAFAWAPADPLLDRWLELYHEVTAENGAVADAGRHLLGWARAAGLVVEAISTSTWTFADPAQRAWWGGLWAERVTASDLATQAIRYELSDAAELEAIAGAWRRWAEEPDGFFAVLHGEVVARHPGLR